MTNDYPLAWSQVENVEGVYERQEPIDGKAGKFVIIVRNRDASYTPFLLDPSDRKGVVYDITHITSSSVLKYEEHYVAGRARWRKVEGIKFCCTLILERPNDDC